MICEIFLPSGVVWQVWEQHIRTRSVRFGRVIMPRRWCGGDWREWLTTARNITDRRESAWVTGMKGRAL